MSTMVLLLTIENKKLGIQLASDGIIFIPSFTKIDHLVHNLNRGETSTYTESMMITKAFFFFLRKQSPFLYILIT
jgi:hypothetical protein